MTQTDDHMRWTWAEWEHRSQDGATSPAEVFTSAELDGLDAPVRRHLRQAIKVGTPLVQRARVTMHGSIKIGRWLPFRARQILCPHSGFIWSARVAGVIAGSDRYRARVGGMDWKLAGLVPLVHAEGPDTSRSAAGRGGAEAIWLPTALLPRSGVRWTAQDERHISARYLLDDTPIDLRCALGKAGEITSLALDRWGDPNQDGRWDWYPFGGTFTSQRTFGGLSIPSTGQLGWHYGTDRWQTGEFFRYEITDLRPLDSRHPLPNS